MSISGLKYISERDVKDIAEEYRLPEETVRKIVKSVNRIVDLVKDREEVQGILQKIACLRAKYCIRPIVKAFWSLLCKALS